jgi:hypothetical protein
MPVAQIGKVFSGARAVWMKMGFGFNIVSARSNTGRRIRDDEQRLAFF